MTKDEIEKIYNNMIEIKERLDILRLSDASYFMDLALYALGVEQSIKPQN